MVLSDAKIRELQKEKEIISPWNEGNLGPNSYDLTLSSDFLVLDKDANEAVLDIRTPVKYKRIQLKEGESFDFPPFGFVLAGSVEKVHMPNGLVGFLEARTSIGRKGLFVPNARFIDSGFSGRVTLQLFNASGFHYKLVPGIRVCQLVIEHAVRSEITYDKRETSKYNGANGPVGSRMEQDQDLP